MRDTTQSISLVIRSNSSSFLRAIGKYDPFFMGVEVFVGFAVEFAAGHTLSIGVAETNKDFLRRISARRVESYFDFAFLQI